MHVQQELLAHPICYRLEELRQDFDKKKQERIDICNRWHVSSDEVSLFRDFDFPCMC